MPDGTMRVKVLEADKGRSVLLTTPSGKHILIDGGGDLSVLESLAKELPFFSRVIDLLVLTKPTNDTVVSFPFLLDRFQVGGVLMIGVTQPIGAYENFLASVHQKKLAIITPHPAMTLDLGDGTMIHTLWPRTSLLGKEVTQSELKNTSIVLRATHHKHSILFLPSLDEDAERALLASGENLKADTLVLLQPTGKNFPSTGSLLAIKPSTVLIAAPPDVAGNLLKKRLKGLGIGVGD